MRRPSPQARALPAEQTDARKSMEVAYIEALNIGLLNVREVKGQIRDRALLDEAERLNRSSQAAETPPETLAPPSGRATIPPPSWKQSRG